MTTTRATSESAPLEISLRRLMTFGSVFAIAAVLAFSVYLLVQPGPNGEVFASVEVIGNSLDRVSGGKSFPLQTGDRIGSGEVVRSGRSGTSVLALQDGSRVELQSDSQITFDAAKDGVRISLLEGSVIVNAVHQGPAHLYVKTRDYLVSVVGTVFLVNTNSRGSRVAVIEGTVRVEQGAEARTIRGGEQLGTASGTDLPVMEQVLWSRNASRHLELLRQTAPVQGASSAWPDVTGTVRFSNGQRLSGAQVNLRLALAADEKQDLVFTTETLQDGSYRFEKVPPGKYAVSIPNTETKERIVEVAAGTRIASIDFSLPEP